MGDVMPLPEIDKPSWLDDKASLESYAKSLDPQARLAVKSSWMWFGNNKTNATTIGRTVYIPRYWDVGQVIRVLPHEILGHIKQFRWCGLFIHPNLGIFPGMALIYLWGVVLPILFAWGRYRCELHAETESWRYHLNRDEMTATDVRLKAIRFAKTVASWAYLKAWPESWALWGFKRRAERVISRSRK